MSLFAVGLLSAAALLLLAPRAEAAYLYWANAAGAGTGTIGRANLDGTGANSQYITTGMEPCGVAADSTHVYWTAAAATGYVGRASLQTGAVENTFLKTPADYPCGVAVGPSSVFYVSHNPQVIGRANLDGSGQNNSFISPAGINPQLPTVYGNHLYWANKENGSIARADLDGGNVKLDFIPNASASCNTLGVAVNSHHVYWAVDYPCYTIGRANLDGSNPEEKFIEPDSAPCGIAASEADLYWAGANGNIVHADVAGTNVDENFIKAGNAFCGVTIGPDPAPPGPPPGPPAPGGFKFVPPVTCTKGCKQILVKFKFEAAGKVVAAPVKAKGKKAKKKPALVKKLTKSVGAGLVTLKLKPTKAGKEAIAKTGKIKAKLTFTYTPNGGAASKLTRTVKAKPPKPPKSKKN